MSTTTITMHVLHNVTTDEHQRPAIFTRYRGSSRIKRGDQLVHVWQYDDNGSGDGTANLNRAFMLTNIDAEQTGPADAALITDYRSHMVRSVCAGDVLVIEHDGERHPFAVETVGFRPVDLTDYAVAWDDGNRDDSVTASLLIDSETPSDELGLSAAILALNTLLHPDATSADLHRWLDDNAEAAVDLLTDLRSRLRSARRVESYPEGTPERHREWAVPVMFDVTAPDRGEAAAFLVSALRAADLPGTRGMAESVHMIESWWMPLAIDKRHDGNDNGAMLLVDDREGER